MTQTTTREAPMSMQELFGEVIHSYSRAQGIEDGVLVDVSELATEAGLKIPVAMTAAAYADTVEWTKEDDDRKSGWTTQSNEGRLWDVMFIAGLAARRNRGSSTVPFEIRRVPRAGRGTAPRRVVLTMTIGPGDAGEPVMTIMEPGED